MAHYRTAVTAARCDPGYSLGLNQRGASSACEWGSPHLRMYAPALNLRENDAPVIGRTRPKTGSIEPWAVELAHDGPCDPRVAIGIAAVELISVIQYHGPIEGSRGIGRPFEDFLGPVHPHIVVHPAGRNHFALGGVPEIVVGFGALQLLQGITIRARVAGMFEKRFACPGRSAFPVS